MSYDLSFFKLNTSSLSEAEIANYLAQHLGMNSENGNNWFYLNDDTQSYFSFELNQPFNSPEQRALEMEFENYSDTNLGFSLNYMRPSFFGLEAFRFVDQLINDFGLLILDTQSSFEVPVLLTQETLFQNWNRLNLKLSRSEFNKVGASFINEEKSTEIWNYNFNRKRLQRALGDKYFVPKMFFFKTKQTAEVITVTTWTAHIPTVIPPADFFLLIRLRKKLFRTVEEHVFISRQTLLANFGKDFENFEFKDCKIIHPTNAARMKDKFNSIQQEINLADFAEALPMEKLFNARPD